MEDLQEAKDESKAKDSEFSFNCPDILVDLPVVVAEQELPPKASSRNSGGFSSIASDFTYRVSTLENQGEVMDPVDSSSDESVKFEQVNFFIDGIEVLPTPYDYIFANRSVLDLQILVEDSEKEAPVPSVGCCAVFWMGCGKKREYNEKVELERRVMGFGACSFDHQVALHGNLILSWYFENTGRKVFRLEPRIWQRLGFISENPNTNGLQYPGSPLILLHLMYFKQKAPGAMNKFKEACLNPNASGSLISISSSIIKFSLQLFCGKQFCKYLESASDRPLVSFLSLHSGIVILWCECFERAEDKDNTQKIIGDLSKKTNNLSMVVELFNSQCSRELP